MKNLYLGVLFAVLLVATGYAQERQVGVQAIYTHSPGTGHDNGVGVKGDVVVPVNRFFTALAECGWEVQPKSYIGDGSALRARIDGRVYMLADGYDFAPFGMVGVAGSRQFTSQYTKGAVYLTAGAGVSFRQKAVAYWRHYFQEHQTANEGTADEFGVEMYWPLSPKSPWRIRGNVVGTNVRFTQPNGAYVGRHSTLSWQMGMGIALVF